MPMNRHSIRCPIWRVCAGLLAVAALDRGRGEEEASAPEVAVQTAPIVRATVRSYVTAYGTVEPEPASAERPAAAAVLAPAAGGLVTAVEAAEGDRVSKGNIVVRLDARLADAALERARLALRYAESVLARQQRLAQIDGTSEKNLQEAQHAADAARAAVQAAEADRSMLDVAAPMDGIVSRVMARIGETAAAGQPLAVLIDTGRLVASAALPLREADSVKVGNAAEVRSAAGRAVAASLTYVAPEATAGTDTVAVRLSLPADSGLRPGQFVTARIVSEERADRLVVPYESVYTDHEGTTSISLLVDGRSKRIEVVRGLRDGRLVEVSGEGLDAGATVITTGSYALPDGTKVRQLDGAAGAPVK